MDANHLNPTGVVVPQLSLLGLCAPEEASRVSVPWMCASLLLGEPLKEGWLRGPSWKGRGLPSTSGTPRDALIFGCKEREPMRVVSAPHEMQ